MNIYRRIFRARTSRHGCGTQNGRRAGRRNKLLSTQRSRSASDWWHAVQARLPTQSASRDVQAKRTAGRSSSSGATAALAWSDVISCTAESAASGARLTVSPGSAVSPLSGACWAVITVAIVTVFTVFVANAVVPLSVAAAAARAAIVDAVQGDVTGQTLSWSRARTAACKEVAESQRWMRLVRAGSKAMPPK